MRTKSWLWPDHAIGKRESRRLRDEHNTLVNQGARMFEVLQSIERSLNDIEKMARQITKDNGIANLVNEKAEWARHAITDWEQL